MRERRRRREKAAGTSSNNIPSAVLFAEGYEAALRGLEEKMRDCPDLVRRRLVLPGGEAMLFFLDGLVDRDLLQRDLLTPLSSSPETVLADPSVLPVAEWHEETLLQEAVERLFYGFALLVVKDRPSALAFAFKGWKERTLDEPEVERNIRGAHEGFTEDLSTNMAILRRRLRTPQLKFKQLKLGKRAPSRFCLAYLEDLVSPEILARLAERLARIDLDVVQSPSY
ncbi:MAG: spore germination protein, partial [Firmicutes bacterium]|nr:spore germination protein [Bacillota bacterium]